jgi:hypothetical protein
MLLIDLFPQSGAENQRMPNRVALPRVAQRLQRLPGVTAVSFSRMGPVVSSEFKNAASVASSQDQPVQAVLEPVEIPLTIVDGGLHASPTSSVYHAAVC